MSRLRHNKLWEFELILINVLLKHYSGLNGNDYAICCIYAKNSLKFKIICLYDLKKKRIRGIFVQCGMYEKNVNLLSAYHKRADYIKVRKCTEMCYK